ncbi:PfkB family carbohydrate kinase [Pseudonocardia sp. WMMC193]|uniref:PfkB family carbohydrate kinase n=1 Tax=Pseudonocardia sp. WMMC193 TaxID=2911965 RepID=UPI001F3DDB7C|nr:PfkB family carbohydrate kinase [Pseudonocardia sp. WMMC193]MCF7553543.1 PfkB family carbohydrate kinase [Pseudonocardia sp. WMMC193]
MRPVVVVGDVRLDVDVHGTVDRLCPDTPVPVLDVVEERSRPGGAGLAAAVLAGSGVPTTLVTALADDGDGMRSLLEPSVRVVAGRALGDTPTTRRWHGPQGPLLCTDTGGGTPAPGFGATVRNGLRSALDAAGAVLVSDDGRGVTADPVVRELLTAAVDRGTPVVWDPHPRGHEPVPGTVLIPNAAEATAALGLVDEDGDAVGGAVGLQDEQGCRAVVVTRGERGAVLVVDAHCIVVPAVAAEQGDPRGAGDAFAGRLAATLADGIDLLAGVTAAVEETGRFVAAGGAAAVRRSEGRWTQA